ncbi:MAG TPA: heat-inducible transcriptional repressor HrcA [Bryobacteraceae bacterium]|nr:heat-inducible transcriptional repressor HrcA [Bryobacteraceae bacterium]
MSGRESSPGLTERQRLILHSIVRAYIDTGEPIGSRTISRMRNLALSPATIRNVMADLADEGYLAQPHTSAGRVPTEQAFRDFAGSVTARPLPASDRERVVAQMQSSESLEDRIGIASRALTEITRNVGIASVLPASAQELEHLELIGLSDRRVLMIVATRDRMVRNRAVTLDQAISQDDLTQLRNYVNLNFAGWTLDRARAELMRRIEEERSLYDAFLQRLTLLCQKGLLVADSEAEFALDGASYLVGLDLHLTRERTRELFRALEEKERVLALLDRFLDGSGKVSVHVGLGKAHPAMSELSLIGVSIDLPSGLRTRLAVLGPMRMQYEKVMSTVVGISKAFETVQS